MATITSTTSGNLSVGTTWVGGVAPVNGDVIVIANGHVVTVDANITLGDKVSSVGDAITINGASSASFGTLKVNAGVSLTLRGKDTTSNRTGLVNRYGTFQLLPGSTLIFDTPSAGTGVFVCNGIFTAQGTSGSRITIKGNNFDWNNSASNTISASVTKEFDARRDIYAYNIGHPWISNSTGTGIGSFGNSSFSISSCTFNGSAGGAQTEVASYDAITAENQYYVDYEIGVIYWKRSTLTLTTAFNVSYKYMTMWGTRIELPTTSTYNEGMFEYCDFLYMGANDNATNGCILYVVGKNMGGTSQRFYLANCTFHYGYRYLLLQDCAGTSGSPILVENNEFHECIISHSAYSPLSTIQGNSYITIRRNYIKVRSTTYFTINVFSAITNLVITENLISSANGIAPNAQTIVFPSLQITNNLLVGNSLTVVGRGISNFLGSSGNPVVVTGNVICYYYRGLNYSSYNTISNNWSLDNYHHHINYNSGGVNQNVFSSLISYNVFVRGQDNGAISLAYNSSNWIDDITVKHNTTVGSSYGFEYGDRGDNTGSTGATLIDMHSNLITGATEAGFDRITETAPSTSYRMRAISKRADWNSYYGNLVNINVSGQGFGTAYMGGNEYNTNASRNCLGCYLQFPSTAPLSGKSLVLTVTSASDITLAWGGGSAVQIVKYSGTATSATTSVVNDTGKSFPTAMTDALTPRAMWVVINGQTARVCTANTSTQMTVAPDFSGTPSGAYNVYLMEVQLTAADSTKIIVGIDMRALPTTPGTYTDSSISIVDRTVSTADPGFVDSTAGPDTWAGTQGYGSNPIGVIAAYKALGYSSIATIKTYLTTNFAPRNSTLRNAGYDGITVGAIEVQSSSAGGDNRAALKIGISI